MTKGCNNCAWYCHTDGNCYATRARLSGMIPASEPVADVCDDWAFDGLEDRERESYKSLMINGIKVISDTNVAIGLDEISQKVTV